MTTGEKSTRDSIAVRLKANEIWGQVIQGQESIELFLASVLL